MSLTQINKAGLDEIALDHVFTIGASGSSAYTFQGEGLNGTVNNPTLYLTRGKTYRFENGSGGHPIRIQSTSGASGTAYNTGVTNNAGSGTVIVEVQHDAPDVLYYQCTSHAAMNGILYITGALADGGVTTAKIADDAVNNDKLANSVVAAIAANTAKTSNATHTGDVTGSTSLTIANNAVTADKLASNSVTNAKVASNAISSATIIDANVTTAKIADQAVTLAKLPHGTSSNDGKFLRANNGADPSFESVPSPAITGLNGAGNNRVITSDGGTTVTAEDSVTFDGNQLDVISATVRGDAFIGRSNISTPTADVSMYRTADNTMALATASTEQTRIDSSGRVGLRHNLSGASDYNRLVVHNPHSGSCWMQLTSTATGSGINTDGLAIGLNTANTGHIWLRENADLMFATNGTKRMSILAGGGLAFNNDTAEANALDDYEEGTFTPSFNMTGGGHSLTYSLQQGSYTKIGNVVSVEIYLSVTGVNANGSGNLRIGGLPFTKTARYGGLNISYLYGINNIEISHALVDVNTNQIYLYKVQPSSSNYHTTTISIAEAFTTSTQIMLNGIYLAA